MFSMLELPWWEHRWLEAHHHLIEGDGRATSRVRGSGGRGCGHGRVPRPVMPCLQCLQCPLLLIGGPVSCLVFLFLAICLPRSAGPSALWLGCHVPAHLPQSCSSSSSESDTPVKHQQQRITQGHCDLLWAITLKKKKCGEVIIVYLVNCHNLYFLIEISVRTWVTQVKLYVSFM